MRRAPGEVNVNGIGRLRFAHMLLALVLLSVVFMSIQVPQLFEPNIVPRIFPPLDVVDEGAESWSSGEPARRIPDNQRRLIANEVNQRARTHLQRQLPLNDARELAAPSKVEDAIQVELKTNVGKADDSSPSRVGLGGNFRRQPGQTGAWEDHNYVKGSLRSVQEMRSSTNNRQTGNHPNRTEAESSNDRSLQSAAQMAWLAGAKAWKEVEEAIVQGNKTLIVGGESGEQSPPRRIEVCPSSLAMTGKALEDAGRVMFLPCGLMFGSAITLVGKPKEAHIEHKPLIARVGEGVSQEVMVSQFLLELQGLKVVGDEDPPRILHVNPRLRGDWSWKPVIEQNTCYRGQWGAGQRCEGWQSPDDEETVDGQPKCEKWLREDNDNSRQSKKSSWLDRLMGRSEKETVEWEYPFAGGQLFVLTIQAGLEGFHLTVDGRHISSFPYRTGYIVEEATGVLIAGDLELHSVVATALPSIHPSFSSELVLEMSDNWKAPPVPSSSIDLFIGILSTSNHFAERMAVRKTWLQSQSIRASNVVARFFVALHAKKDINVQLKREADYYGDIILLPFIDRYDLVVIKTVAICEFGVQNVTAKYIMKCDDDTFVRVDSVLKEVKATSVRKGLYMGNMNEYHQPLRTGKWAVTFEEWPERIYPTYANGPGYILSEDIARFIVSSNMNNSLRLFKMEDVSVGMWVGQFGTAKQVPLQYENNLRFCQFGCVDNYLTAHYQSPRQMLCMWEKLSTSGEGKCCDV